MRGLWSDTWGGCLGQGPQQSHFCPAEVADPSFSRVAVTLGSLGPVHVCACGYTSQPKEWPCHLPGVLVGVDDFVVTQP